MENECKNNFPAFPAPKFMYRSDLGVDQDKIIQLGNAQGMSLRDYFAGQFLVGMVSNNSESSSLTFKQFAKSAYSAADAMLEERNTGRD